MVLERLLILPLYNSSPVSRLVIVTSAFAGIADEPESPCDCIAAILLLPSTAYNLLTSSAVRTLL